MLRSVICTCPPILENRIIPSTYADTVLHKAFGLIFADLFLDKAPFFADKMTYADPRLGYLC
jgi:hypothetical protein